MENLQNSKQVAPLTLQSCSSKRSSDDSTAKAASSDAEYTLLVLSKIALPYAFYNILED